SHASPAEGRSRPPSRCSRVDFPQPLGPITARVSPEATSSSTPSSARTRPSPWPYSFSSARVRKTGPTRDNDSFAFMIVPSLRSSNARRPRATEGRPAASAPRPRATAPRPTRSAPRAPPAARRPTGQKRQHHYGAAGAGVPRSDQPGCEQLAAHCSSVRSGSGCRPRSLDDGPRDRRRLAPPEEPAGSGGGQRHADYREGEVEEGHIAQIVELVVVHRSHGDVGS